MGGKSAAWDFAVRPRLEFTATHIIRPRISNARVGEFAACEFSRPERNELKCAAAARATRARELLRIWPDERYCGKAANRSEHFSTRFSRLSGRRRAS